MGDEEHSHTHTHTQRKAAKPTGKQLGTRKIISMHSSVLPYKEPQLYSSQMGRPLNHMLHNLSAPKTITGSVPSPFALINFSAPQAGTHTNGI